MSRFAQCPGEGCDKKVKIWPGEVQEEINFCCVPCWEYTWQTMFSEDTEGAPTMRGHSGGCRNRQAERLDDPVVKGTFKVHTPKRVPPSRLGGKGGTQV